MVGDESAAPCHRCELCDEVFTSKTKLFKHLVVHGFESNSLKPTKIVLLIGWHASPVHIRDSEQWISDQAWNCQIGDETSYSVEQALFRALYVVENKLNSVTDISAETVIERSKGYSRGSSCLQRTSSLYGTEPSCHGLCDTFCVQVRPLGATSIHAYAASLNKHLPSTMQILHSYELASESASSFHAETECSQRRYEYLMPLRAVMPMDIVTAPIEPIVRKSKFRSGQNPSNKNVMDSKFPLETVEGQKRIAYFRMLKEIGREFAGRKRYHNYTTAGATMNENTTMRRIDRIFHKDIVMLNDEPWVVFSVSGDAMLRGQVRRLLAMTLAVALGFLPIDYLRASIHSEDVLEVPSLPGWGLYLAECRYANWEANYTSSRLDPRRNDANGKVNDPTLISWTHGLHEHIASHAASVFPTDFISSFQTHCQQILTRYHTLQILKQKSRLVLKHEFVETFKIVDEAEVDLWCNLDAEESADADGADGANAKPDAVEAAVVAGDAAMDVAEDTSAAVVLPLDEAKAGGTGSSSSRIKPEEYQQMQARLSFVQIMQEHDDCPTVYQEVLYLLREADRSQLWPASSTGRMQVISAGSLIEKGGRGGSFSVGALPRHMAQPKGNDLFPALLRAAFRLERLIAPHRPPSATIAINRHAEFLAHRDSGAGSGQSLSLIVALGAYAGGELVVDHAAHDIRYQPLEFDGWKQIHATLPFVGERYSLVWFTPLGLGPEDLWWWQDEKST